MSDIKKMLRDLISVQDDITHLSESALPRNYALRAKIMQLQGKRAALRAEIVAEVERLRTLVGELVSELDDIMDTKGHTARTRPLIDKAREALQ